MKRRELRQLILEAFLEVIQEQEGGISELPLSGNSEKDTLPKPEKKPIPQEIKKNLGKVIDSLFGSSHLEFVEKIQLVVPNPSEFQVFLKNGQSFYLKWMGKPSKHTTSTQGSFQAEIEGKKYFLNSISQYEQALDRLGDLLKNGPITLNQDGGEFGASSPETGGTAADFPGGEGGSTETEFGAPAPVGGETPEEDFETPESEPGEELPSSL